MRRINLLPPEERRSTLSGVRTNTRGLLLVAAAAVLVLIALTAIFALVRINSINSRIAELDRNISVQNSRLQQLQPYTNLQNKLSSKEEVANGVVRTRFAWDQFLQGLAFVIPDATSLQSMTAQASPVNINAPLNQTLRPPGSVTFTGLAEPNYTNVADFVVRMNTLRFLADSQLDFAELDRRSFTRPAINFEVKSQLITRVGERESTVRTGGGTQPQQGTPASRQYSGASQASTGLSATMSRSQ